MLLLVEVYLEHKDNVSCVRIHLSVAWFSQYHADGTTKVRSPKYQRVLSRVIIQYT